MDKNKKEEDQTKSSEYQSSSLTNYLRPLAIGSLIIASLLLIYVVWSKYTSKGFIGGFYKRKHMSSNTSMKGGCGCSAGSYN